MAAGAIAVAPMPAKQAEIPVVNQAIRLVADGDSLANVPLNLFYDFINIPANELHALQFSTDSLFNSGPWFVVSPTNLWGVDPGDPSHFMTVMNFLLPFPALSGMDSPETDFDGGLGQQLWGLMAAELPTSSGCDALDCTPELPVSPVTGMSGIDFWAWLPEMLQRGTTQDELFPLFANWIDVPLNDLTNGYYFNPAFDGSSEPADPGGGPAYAFDGWSSSTGLLGGQGIPGTTPVTEADGSVVNYMPWSGETYTLQPWVPFENFWNSLLAPPSTSGLDGTGIDPIYGNFTEIEQTFQAFFAGSMMFDPFTPGSPFCPGDCSAITSAGLDYPDLIKDIGNMMPGNPVINEWLNDYANGTANVPTETQIQNAIDLLQNKSFWDFQNPSPADNPYAGDAQFFHDLWTSLGFTVPALNPDTYGPASDVPVATATSGAASTDTLIAALNGALSGEAAGFDWLSTIGPDFTSMFGADFTNTFGTDLASMFGADFASMLGF